MYLSLNSDAVPAILVAKVEPPSNSDQPNAVWVPRKMISSATVSPRARPRPSIAPLKYPDRPNGSTVVLTTSHRVAPSASAASIWSCGVCTKTSRVTAVMIGRIITAKTIPPVKMVPPPATDALPRGEQEAPAHGVVEPDRDGPQLRCEHVQTPDAVDDRGNRGQQIDHVGQRSGEPPRRVLREEYGDAQGDRHRQDQGEHRHEHGHLQQIEDSESHRRGVGGDPLAAVGEEILSIALQARVPHATAGIRRSRRPARPSGHRTPPTACEISGPRSRGRVFPHGLMGTIGGSGKGAATTAPEPASAGFGVVTVIPSLRSAVAPTHGSRSVTALR